MHRFKRHLDTMHPPWFVLTLLAATSNVVIATQYSQQLIGIVGTDKTVDKAAKFLYDKNPQVSQVAKWYPTDPNDFSKGGTFKPVKWNKQTEEYVTDPKKSLTQLPKKARIQVVGHGDISNKKKVTLGGLTADELGTELKKINMKTPLKRVSLVGCSVGELNKQGTKFVGNEYPKALLKNMKGTAEEVSSRTKIVGVDSSGRKVYGEETPTGTVWRTDSGDIYKTVVSYDKKGNVKVAKEQIKTPKWEAPKALRKTFDPPGGYIELEEMGAVGGAAPEHTDLDNEDIFYAVDDITRQFFGGINVPSNWEQMNVHQRAAKVWTDKTKTATTRKTLPIKENNDYQDFCKELKHWGEEGFTKPVIDKTTNTKQTRKPNGKPFENKFSYYRYGDFVYSFQTESTRLGPFGLNPFYAKFEGVIVNEHPNNPPSTDKNTKLNLPKDYTFGSQYRHLQKKTNEDFLDNAERWMEGDRSQIGTSVTDAVNGEATIAMFHAESVRDFRVHTTNRLAMDMEVNAEYHRNNYFKSHPIGRGGGGQAKLSGLREGYYGTEAKPTQGYKPDAIRSLVSEVVEQWTEKGYEDTVRNTRKRPSDSTSAETQSATKRQKLIDDFKAGITEVLESNPTQGSDHLNREIAGPLSEPYDSREIQELQTESASNELNEYHEGEDFSLPTRASDAMLRDQMYVSEEMTKTVESYEQTTGKDYEVDKDSVKYESGKVVYDIYEPTDHASREEMETPIDEDKMTSQKLMNEMNEKSEELNEEPETPGGTKESINTGLAIYGTIMGIKGTVEAFERGDVMHGSINLAQTLHGIGELAGVNKVIYDAAGEFVGRVAQKQVTRISESVEQYLGADIGKQFASEGSELLSSIGELGEAFEDIPIIGTAFGIYNIYEDIQQHTVIGYVDAGLDTLITAIGLLAQPELEPLVIALTIVRLGIDTFYADITKELNSLPPDASVGETVVAVLKGVGEAIFDIYDTITGGIYSAAFKIAKLEKQYAQDRQFLADMEDYHNYYKVTKCNGDSADIDFASGKESWNGGDIYFNLYEGGSSGQLQMKTVNNDGQEVSDTQTLYFNTKVTDMTLGIGESHTVTFKKSEVKVFWVIPVDEKSLIDGLQGDRNSLHGEYHGNSDNNTFYTIQEMPPGQDYKLSDYHYVAMGFGGNDTFHFGPQFMQAHGGPGMDMYYVTEASRAAIRTYDVEETDDYLILPSSWDLGSYTCFYSHYYVIIENGDFYVTLEKYGVSTAYQHLIIKSGDHFVSRVEYEEGNTQCSLVPFALSAGESDKGVGYYGATSPYQQVTQLIGSDYGDAFYGNAMDNIIVPGKGVDTVSGGEGADTYSFEYYEDGTSDQVINLALDGQLDTLIFPALAGNMRGIGNSHGHLILSSTDGTYQITVANWFIGPEHQHLTVYTQDSIFMIIRQIDDTHVDLIPTLKELTPDDNTVDLLTNSVLRQVTSVVGTVGRTEIKGNDLDNYIAGGEGSNYLQGREGADQYVIKKSPPTASRKKRASAKSTSSFWIYNFAHDNKTDMILFEETYDNIVVESNNQQIFISSAVSGDLNTNVAYWFLGAEYRHLSVRSADGIVFSMPNVSSNPDSSGHLKKTPTMIDRSKSEVAVDSDLRDPEYHSVERVIGSSYVDNIFGNSLDNYFDPREGDAVLTGGNGSDTYVIKKGYGQVTIHNEADDDVADTIALDAPYSDIVISDSAHHVILTYSDHQNTDEYFSVTLHDYKQDPRTQHLTILTSDGVSFVIDAHGSFTPVKVSINNVNQNITDAIADLTEGGLQEIRSFYCNKSVSNIVVGNNHSNTIVGGDLADYFHGGNGNDILKGGGGKNDLFGDEGNDTLSGGSDNDELQGGPGNDVLSGGAGDNFIDGGDDEDTVIYTGNSITETGVYVDLDNEYAIHDNGTDDVINVENVIATPYNDTLISSSATDNALNGQGGPDILKAIDGYDMLIGGDGSDIYDLIDATGTKVIINEANDTMLDTVDFSVVNKSQLRFESKGDSIIIRVVSDDFPNSGADQFPSCSDPIPGTINLWPSEQDAEFCETYSLDYPTIILKDYLLGSQHRHLAIVTEECSLDENFLSQLPLDVVCH